MFLLMISIQEKKLYKKERQSGIKDMLVRFVEKDTFAPNIIITSEYLDGYYSTQDKGGTAFP